MSIEASPATLSEWQSLAQASPDRAAQSWLSTVETRLNATQLRAVFTQLPTHSALTEAFAQGVATGGPLAGVPYGLKDLFAADGTQVLAGGALPSGCLPDMNRDGHLAARLRRAGAVLAAKTHLHEFAYGLTGENEHYGHCHHPLHPQRTSGGSSSGSAVAVAAGLVPFAIGTDTGGSIRVPAAFCGLYGLRLVPHGPDIADAFPLVLSFDTAGWMTRTADDLLTLHSSLLPSPRPTEKAPRGLALDYAAFPGVNPDPECQEAYERAAAVFAPTSGPALLAAAQTAFGLTTKAYAVLQSTEAFQVHSAWLDTQREHYSEEVWSRIDRGRRWAPDERASAEAKWREVLVFWEYYFREYDYLILPATPFPVLLTQACTLENRNRLLALTTPASLGGRPVLTVPVALSGGLTTGLQIVVSDASSPVLAHILTRISAESPDGRSA